MLSKKQSVTVVFKKATVYGATSIDTYPGESFTLILVGYAAKVKWFANNDSVLNIAESPDSNTAIIQALKPGKSSIIIKGIGFIHKILITVKINKANTLSITFGKPVPK